MSRLILDARETVSPFYDPIEPVLNWEDLVEAAKIREHLASIRNKDHAESEK